MIQTETVNSCQNAFLNRQLEYLAMIQKLPKVEMS